MMRRRIALALFAVWSVLALGATWMGRPVSAPFPSAPFSHKNHVDRNWAEESASEFVEVFRDCRGCHRFSSDDPYSSPQAGCEGCHEGSGALQLTAEPGWEDSLQAYRTRTHVAFRHYSHGMLECRECHDARGNLLEDHIPIRTGPGHCARCHGDQVTEETVARLRWYRPVSKDAELAKACGLSETFTIPTNNAAYAKKLDEVFAGENGGINGANQFASPIPPGGIFDHGDHIVEALGSDQALVCADCHTSIKKADATNVGTGQITVSGCKVCHIRDAKRNAAEPSAQTKQTDPQPLWSLGAFAHKDHYGWNLAGSAGRDSGVSNAQGYDDIKDKDCGACHTYAPLIKGVSERDFPFDGKNSRHEYADCITCHALDGWQTGEEKGSEENPPLHTSNGGDGWRACVGCHELGKPDMAGLRKKEAVRRWTERTFVFEGQTHPHITSNGISKTQKDGGAVLQKECSQCHRAIVPSLPSRLIEKPFTHRTHLPPNPTQKDCVGCHESASKAANAVALAGVDYLTYTLTSCSSCHWGGEIKVQVQASSKPASRSVVAFPHALHVKAGQSCADCHVLDAASGRDMQTLPEAASCVKCHKHEQKADGARPPEVLIAKEVASCIRCHHEDDEGQQVASVPPARGSVLAEADSRYRSTQTAFGGFRQSQYHPASSNCVECHRANIEQRQDNKVLAAIQIFGPMTFPSSGTLRSHFSASSKKSVHAVSSSDPFDCLRCHWMPLVAGTGGGKYQAALAPSSPPAGEDPSRKRLRALPGSAAVRKALGDRFESYPGRKSDG